MTFTLAALALAVAATSAAPDDPPRTPHRVVLQVRAGAGGGNPNRIDMAGETSIYIEEVSATPLRSGEPITMNTPSTAYQPVAKVIPHPAAPVRPGSTLPDLDEATDSTAVRRLDPNRTSTTGHESTLATDCYAESGPIPDGMTFVVTRAVYHGTAVGDGGGEFVLVVANRIIAHAEDTRRPIVGVWKGQVPVASGAEHTLFLEVANSSSGFVDVSAYLPPSVHSRAARPTDAPPADVGTAELFARSRHEDDERATFSFEHGVRDDPQRAITRNDWDVHYDGTHFDVLMVTDDRSVIVDLGEVTWDAVDVDRLVIPTPDAEPPRAGLRGTPVLEGRMYLVRTADSETDLAALMRVDAHEPDDRVQISWRLLDDV